MKKSNMNVQGDKTSIEKEFENIENNKLWKIVMMSLREESDKITKNESFENARKPCNRSRNRYRDVLPYDNTRVKLVENESSDYINASYVNLENNRYGRKYILTQGPLVSTISHFWKMVWNENSNCIIMLNKIIEKDNIKCAQYFPLTEEENDNHIYSDVNLSVSIINSVITKAYIKRTFVLRNEKTQETRNINQFHYQTWPDFGVPCSSEMFLQFLWDIRSSGGLDSCDRPSIIHCSAGIGRSGTFVLIDLSLLQIAEEKSCNSLNLKEMLVELRKCRIGLIQTAEQLRFAFCSIISGAKALLEHNNQTNDVIQFIDVLDSATSESIEYSSESEEEVDSDISENIDSNEALDNAAAAVRTRRGLPATNNDTNLLLATQNNFNKDVDCTKVIDFLPQNSYEHDRKAMREERCNRTRQIIADIRTNMRQQDLERERILSRLGLNRLVNVLTRQNRTSLIAGASAMVGLFSFVCGYVVYKYVG